MTTSVAKTRTVPGPKPIPVLGWRANFLQFMQSPLGYLGKLNQQYGTIAGLVENHQSMIFVFSPEYNRIVLSDQELFHNMSLNNGFFPIPETAAIRDLNTNLFTMNGEVHKKHRRLAMPAFHKNIIERHRDEIVAIAESTIEGWQPGSIIDIYQQMSQMTLRIAIQSFLGVDTTKYLHNIDDMLAHSLNDLFKKSVLMFPVNLPGTPYRRMLDNTERLGALIRELIAQKRANPHDHHDVLAMLIEARDEDGSALTDTELLGQAHILISAGHESSTSTLTWVLLLLSQHPDILADVLDEMDSLLHGAAPTTEQLGQMKLLDNVIKESLRVLSPSSVGSRVSADEFEIGPYHFNKGTLVTVCPHIIHHSAEIYDDPYTFRPSRWETINPSPYEYLPFSAGPRLCIGQSFAMMEFKITLSIILQRYRLTVVPGAVIDPVVKPILSPKTGVPMIVAHQDRRFRKTDIRGTIHSMVTLTEA
ncbi:MAG: cytochrome P450 [Herpetosiphonaceae bacterium]|nr:cytochrome P450 [Herpetosiphonaceae bacterium]